MARPKKTKQVEDYRHEESTRLNNPPAGLAWQDTDRPPKRTFEYDPRVDPQLVWAGKAERISFSVDAPSIHVHERLSTEAIIKSVQKEPPQLSLFEDPELDRSKTVQFYEHEMGWVNRLVLGDSLIVMTSLVEKERLGGQVQVVYFDPPYGINYNSNFQARISNRSPKETSDDSLTREPEQIQAYRDTWKLGVHSYLTYLRDRMLIAHELLNEQGSIFVQIGPDRLHLVRCLLDEIFGSENACPTITVQKTSGHDASFLPEVADFLLWYAKDKKQTKYRQLFEERSEKGAAYSHVELQDGTRRPMTAGERNDPSLLPSGSRIFRYGDITSQGRSRSVPFEFEGRVFHPGSNLQWKIRLEGMEALAKARRLAVVGNTLSYIRYIDDFAAIRRTNIWTDTGRAGFEQRKKQYVVETNSKIIERAILMVSDPGDLVLDPTCGSGTTAHVCEKFGRRWITIDTSRVALALARERLLTTVYPHYRLQDEKRGVDAGFRYRALKRITASSIGYGQAASEESLYDQPIIDSSIIRVSGPFSVEALSRYTINPLQPDTPPEPDDLEAAETQDHVGALLDALRKQGIPRKGRKPIPIDDLQALMNIGMLQAEGTFRDGDSKQRRFGVSLGPRFGPITVGQIDEALHDAYGYDLVVFAGFAVTAEAQQYVAKEHLGKFRVALLEANPDLLLGDLLKTTSSSQTFRLFASPDVELETQRDGELRVRVRGVDSFDASTGKVTSLGQQDIAAWFLDQDYDGTVFHITQAFFPRTSGWEALQRALKGTIETDIMNQLTSFESLPFKPGQHRKAAVRVVDDSGTTSEAHLDLPK
jgi:adenine-specific DNA-methyltransferase